jgi:hypothetical protein
MFHGMQAERPVVVPYKAISFYFIGGGIIINPRKYQPLLTVIKRA